MHPASLGLNLVNHRYESLGTKLSLLLLLTGRANCESLWDHERAGWLNGRLTSLVHGRRGCRTLHVGDE